MYRGGFQRFHPAEGCRGEVTLTLSSEGGSQAQEIERVFRFGGDGFGEGRRRMGMEAFICEVISQTVPTSPR